MRREPRRYHRCGPPLGLVGVALGVVVASVTVLGLHAVKNHKLNAAKEAELALSSAVTPEEFEAVANDHAKSDAAPAALLNTAAVRT